MGASYQFLQFEGAGDNVSQTIHRDDDSQVLIAIFVYRLIVLAVSDQLE
jgi:hypothetical protein